MILLPDWPAPANIRAFSTTREGGVSTGPYASLNLSLDQGDDPTHVLENRACLAPWLGTHQIGWLQQVHGCAVVNWDQPPVDLRADAAHTTRTDYLCAIMSADCLPILLCDRAGTWVAAVHAGWRGLAAGVIDALFAQAPVQPSDCMAWLGPAIGPTIFQVGAEVRDIFLAVDPLHSEAFLPCPRGGWDANIYALARRALGRLGLDAVYGGDFCTYHDPRFFSYRRDQGKTGRQASFIGKNPL